MISPHFDDAVLSVGAYIAGRVAAGERVRVLTVYTSGPPVERLSGRRRVFGDYATRCAEDDRALAILGASADRIGLRERLFRDPLPRSGLAVFRVPPRADDLTELPAVLRVVTEVLGDPDTRVLAPLGIGGHHDHVEVAVAAMRAAADPSVRGRLSFYEDFNALSELCRRRHPVSVTAPLRWRDAPSLASPLAGMLVEAMALVSRGAAASTLAGQDPEDARWVWRSVPVGDTEAAKLRAIAEYRTQLPALGGGKRVVAMVRRAHRRRGGEILWRLASGFQGTVPPCG